MKLWEAVDTSGYKNNGKVRLASWPQDEYVKWDTDAQSWLTNKGNVWHMSPSCMLYSYWEVCVPKAAMPDQWEYIPVGEMIPKKHKGCPINSDKWMDASGCDGQHVHESSKEIFIRPIENTYEWAKAMAEDGNKVTRKQALRRGSDNRPWFMTSDGSSISLHWSDGGISENYKMPSLDKEATDWMIYTAPEPDARKAPTLPIAGERWVAGRDIDRTDMMYHLVYKGGNYMQQLYHSTTLPRGKNVLNEPASLSKTGPTEAEIARAREAIADAVICGSFSDVNAAKTAYEELLVKFN